jgi:hypothetical protein
MKKFNATLKIMTLLISACVVLSAAVPAFADEEPRKPIRIKWETLEGIIRFIVQIKDSGGEVVLDKTVETSFIDFLLPPGKYQIRLGAVNKFEKVSFWTEWDSLEIRKSERSKFFTNDFAAKVGLKISVGAAYNMLLPPWNTIYKNSSFTLNYLNYMGVVGFHFGNSKYVNQTGFLKYMGLELEGSYTNYAGIDSIQFVSKLMNVTAGPNLFVKTNLKIPLNFYFRVGGGASYSLQEFTRRNYWGQPLQSGTIRSLDPYAKVGVSIELNFLYAMSLNIGADYLVIFYQDKFFQGLRYFAMLGVRI